MDPLPKQSSRIVDFLPNELDLDLLVHVDFLGLHEAAHQDVAALQTHEICALLPANPKFL